MKMKKNDWLLAGAVAAYSYLFYQQAAGVNYLIFTLILQGLILLQTRSWVFRQKSWQITALASLLTGVNVVLVNSGLAVLANVLSLILLAGYSRMPATSIFVTALNSLYSVFTSFFSYILFREKYFPESAGSPIFAFSGIQFHQATSVGIPVIITAGFLAIYCSASATFSYLVGQIDLSFISISWILFTFTGFWVLFGFFRQLLIEDLTEVDLAAGNTLQRVRKSHYLSFKMPDLKYEYKTGFILLILLNLLLLTFNFSDIFFLTRGELPADIVYSEYLHQGVYMLIFSIVLAIGILLFLFRGNLNFYSRSRPLKMLAFAWMVQNLILVLITLSKNSLYVMEFGLTYKRIGVYTYLTLTIIGLVTSFIKVAAVKNNWFLFRKNAWAAYLVLILASCINWDRFITNHNLSFTREPDLEYLLSLSDSNFGQVYQFIKAPENKQPVLLQKRVEKHRQNVLARIDSQNWQAWNYDDFKIQQELEIEFVPIF
jgi:hypothetical protein